MNELMSICNNIGEGSTVPIGTIENGNFLFVIRDKKENLDKFVRKIETMDSKSRTVCFQNKENKKSTNVHLISLKINTGNFYPLFVIEGIGMLDAYSKAKNIELIFYNGEEILESSAILEKEETDLVDQSLDNSEDFIKVFNHMRTLEPYKLEGILAQVERKEIEPIIQFN